MWIWGEMANNCEIIYGNTLYTNIYIYIEREREREREIGAFMVILHP